MKYSWDRRIERAAELSKKYSAVAHLMNFYGELARFQKHVYEKLTSQEDHSINVLPPHFSELLSLIMRIGSPALAETAYELSQNESEWLDLLLNTWQPAGDDGVPHPEKTFFAYALLQPYAECLAGKMKVTSDVAPVHCPFCGSPPQVAVLRQEGDGAKRSLICSLCSTEWIFRRVVCPNCGEEHKDRLPVFIANEFDYVRVDACESCHTYIKSIDLTKNGHAVPVVDELATVSLNLWASENNYQKLSPNLFGI
jgi:FdhE protein